MFALPPIAHLLPNTITQYTPLIVLDSIRMNESESNKIALSKLCINRQKEVKKCYSISLFRAIECFRKMLSYVAIYLFIIQE